jgi:branched-subunit amino acid aminotransferase/4-amino-4-deoxychorismate lyase
MISYRLRPTTLEFMACSYLPFLAPTAHPTIVNRPTILPAHTQLTRQNNCAHRVLFQATHVRPQDGSVRHQTQVQVFSATFLAHRPIRSKKHANRSWVHRSTVCVVANAFYQVKYV